MGRYIGDAGPTGTMTFNPSTKMISWSTQGAANPSIYVNGGLFANAPSGTQAASWVNKGSTYQFELKDMGGAVLASVYVDAEGNVTAETIYGGEIPPADSNGGGGTEQPDGASWFDSSTDLLGVSIPNMALAAGGGLLAVALLKRRK